MEVTQKLILIGIKCGGSMDLQELKEKGLAPEFYTEESLQTVRNGYLINNENPVDMYRRLAESASRILKKPELESEFFTLFWNNWLCPASPILSNLGSDRGLPISCYGQFVPDSIDGIFKTYHEAAMLTKNGGGIGASWDNIRARGTAIKGNGKSEGVVPWLAILDREALAVGQGGVRRAGIQVSLDIEHGDYEEFINIRRPVGDINRQCLNLHHCVNVGDNFMQAVIDGDKNARHKWKELLKTRVETGEPYIMFKDIANNNKPFSQQINNTQLCITGDQRVVTDRGYLTAKELYEQGGNLILFNGFNPVESSPMKLRQQSAEVLEITLSNGMKHKVTKEHGIPVYNKSSRKIKRTEAQFLIVGDLVPVQNNKGLFGNVKMQDEAYLLGLYQGDGTSCSKRKYLDIWENDFDLIPNIQEVFNRVHNNYAPEFYEIKNQTGIVAKRKYEPACFGFQQTGDSFVKKQRLGSNVFNMIPEFEKGKVPSWIWKGTEETQWSYIKGLLETDGTVFNSSSNRSPIQLNLASIDRSFLEQIQLIFNNLGLSSSIRLLRKGGEVLLPDHKGGKKLYETKDCFRLIVGNRTDCLEIEKNTGFISRKGISIENRIYNDNIKKCHKIVSITKLPEETVYCPTVFNDEHIFVANGLLTFNCSEIFLPNDEQHTYVCCLSSLNLVKWEEWKDHKFASGLSVVELSIYFLDAVMQEFINKAKDLPGFEKAVRFSIKSRALGLGVLGWHTLLQEKLLPFDSFQSMMLNAQIFNHIKDQSLEASKKLAIEFGEPEWCKGRGVRNLTQLAIAPTMSNSIISGGHSAGVEPISANCYSMKSAKGTFIRKNKQLVDLLESKGINNVDTWENIIRNAGSVQQIKQLSSEEKEVFKTAREINQFAIVTQAGQRQKLIDQGQSINLFFTAGTSAKYINDVHIHAWQSGLKSLYYLRSETVLKGTTIEYQKSDCASCEG